MDPPPPSRFGGTNKTNEPEKIDPKPPVLDVKPLNSFPYIGPPTNAMHPSIIGAFDDQETRTPSLIFLPSDSTREERDKILDTNESGVVLTGAAALGQVGPILGLIDIGESEDSYLFRVSLPGVLRDNSFGCDIEADGRIFIKGITTTGEKIVCKNSQVFQMQSRNLCPPGHFSVTVQLPGPVDHQQVTGNFETDGILEGIVKKKLP